MTGQPPQLRDQGSVRWGLRIGGAIIFLAGLAFVIAGLADFFGSMNSFSGPKHFWMLFVGMPLVFVGVTMLAAGFLGATTRFVVGEVAPTVKDTIGYAGRGPRTCPSCGAVNARGAGFCSTCGKPLPAGW